MGHSIYMVYSIFLLYSCILSKLGLYLIPLQSLHLSYDLSKCIVPYGVVMHNTIASPT
jgi:hypothetical protein